MINEFVGFLTVGKERQNASPDLRHQLFGLAASHLRLHDETCRYIDNVSDFPRSPRFVGELFTGRHRFFLSC